MMLWLLQTRFRLKALPALLALFVQLALLPVQLLHLGHHATSLPSSHALYFADSGHNDSKVLYSISASDGEHDPATCSFCQSLVRAGSFYLPTMGKMPVAGIIAGPLASIFTQLSLLALSWVPFSPRGPPSTF